MRNIVLGVVSALALGVALVGAAAPARATDLGYSDYDEPTTVITRRTTVEREVVRPRPVVREVVIERPVIYRPRPVVREVFVDRPVVYGPRPNYREQFVERDGFYGRHPFPRGPGGFGYGRPEFRAYD